jgi:hypothetical protein
MESFKESTSKRFEKQKENFKNLADKVKSIEVNLIKHFLYFELTFFCSIKNDCLEVNKYR